MKIIRMAGLAGISATCLLLFSCAGTQQEGVISEETTTGEAVEETAAAVTEGVVASVVGTPTQITGGEFDNGLASVSPDGGMLVYQSNRDGHWQIYALNMESREEMHLAPSESNDENPVWTADGLGVIFVSNRDGGKSEWERDLYHVSVEFNAVTRLTETMGDDWSPVALPGGDYLFLSERGDEVAQPVYLRRSALYRASLSDNLAQEMLGTDFDVAAPAAWDADRVVARTSEGRLDLIGLADRQNQPLTPDGYNCEAVDAYPGKNWIVFTARRDDISTLNLLELTNHTVQELAASENELRAPRFSPDGSRVYYSKPVQGKFQIFEMTLE